jgi:hypothetical protein
MHSIETVKHTRDPMAAWLSIHNGIGQTCNTLVPFRGCIVFILPGRGRWPLSARKNIPHCAQTMWMNNDFRIWTTAGKNYRGCELCEGHLHGHRAGPFWLLGPGCTAHERPGVSVLARGTPGLPFGSSVVEVCVR